MFVRLFCLLKKKKKNTAYFAFSITNHCVTRASRSLGRMLSVTRLSFFQSSQLHGFCNYIQPLFNFTSKRNSVLFLFSMNSSKLFVYVQFVRDTCWGTFFFFFLTCSYVFTSYGSLRVAVLMRFPFFFFSKSTCDCFGFVMCTRLHVFMSNFV